MTGAQAGDGATTLVGEVFTVEVGAVAHGGHCVARLGGEHGRVVFVRHTLPGESVRVLITEDGGKSFCRGDAIEVLRPSPDRVDPPCPFSGPGRCGGCDWQHVDPAAQRRLKQAVVIEQLDRLAGLSTGPAVADLGVEELPGGMLGWRLRTRFAVAPSGRVGLHRHRSNKVEVVDRCLISAPGVGDGPELAQRWGGASGLEIATNGFERSVFVHRPAPATPGSAKPGSAKPGPAKPARAGSDRRRPRRGADRVEQISGPPALRRRVDGHDFIVSATGFWQGHAAAAQVYTDVVLGLLAPQPGEVAFDLYAGAGLFTVALADAVGTTGRVVALEGDAQAVQDARRNLAGYPWAEVGRSPITAAAIHSLGRADLVVLDPPRTGAGRDVMTTVLATGARAVAYVACDPAAFARDVRIATEQDWVLAELRAFDAYPMTHHVECVAMLIRQGSEVF